MQIDRIDIYHVAMPLKRPWTTAYGSDDAIHSLLVKLTSGSDESWGEASTLAAPCYSPEFAAGVFVAMCKWMAPQLVGHDIQSGEDLQHRLSMFKGNQFAKAGLDMAWWTMQSIKTATPLHKLLGATRNIVEVGDDFGVAASLDDLLADVGRAVEEGFARIKLKYSPGWDVFMVDAVRKQHPDTVIHIDCNSGYTLDDLDMFRELDKYHLAMFEQPLTYDDLVDHAKLAKAVDTPICLDESINSLNRVKQAIELGSCSWVNIKPGRVGGLTVAKQIHDLCQSAQIPCWVGGMLESAVGANVCLSLSMLDNFLYPADLFPSSKMYAQDLADPPIERTRTAEGIPAIKVSNIPGNPSKPVPERLAACTVQIATIE